MNLGYKQHFPWGEPTRFREKIIKGIYPYSIYNNIDLHPKIHTIREDPHNRWKPGNIIHHAYGVRTKNYDCFDEGECKSVQEIEIKEYFIDENDFVSHSYTLINKGVPRIFRVFIDSKMLSEDEIDILARNDGFDSTKDFFRWFNKPFKGKIIHWTNLKY